MFKRLIQLEMQNARLKTLLAEAELEKLTLDFLDMVRLERRLRGV